MSEKRPWTEEEDRALKFVFETIKVTKWSHIARRLQEEFGVRGRNGKQCKERYFFIDLDTLIISIPLIRKKSGLTKRRSRCLSYTMN